MNTNCGNARHPRGPWHPATPLPSSWIERIIQRIRRVRYGCGCAVSR